MPRLKENLKNDTLLKMSPEDFLKILASGDFKSQTSYHGIVVTGDVNLTRDYSTKKIEELPPVSITGSLTADETCSLRIIRCRVDGDVKLDGSPMEEVVFSPDLAGNVTGDFSATGCSNLKKISGHFMKNVDLTSSGLGRICSDFSCKGKLSLRRCSALRLVDCEALSIDTSESSIERFGPNTRTQQLLAEDCRFLRLVTAISGLRSAKFDGSSVQEVKQSFKCDGPALFRKCPNLTRVAGQISKIEVSMASLEDVSHLRTNELVLFQCPEIPTDMSGLSCKFITLAHLDIEEVPLGISPQVGLRISNCTRFSRLPSKWGGDISLSMLPSLTSTPEKFSCSSSLDVSECRNLSRVSGHISQNLRIMSETPCLLSLEANLKIGGDLILAGSSSVETLGCEIGGNVEARSANIKQTSDSFRVGGSGDFSKCRKITTLKGYFGGKVLLSGSSVSVLGAGFECAGDLVMDKTDHLMSLNCAVGGITVVTDSSLRKTGPAFTCKGELWLKNCPNLFSLSGEVRSPLKLDELILKNLEEGKIRMNIRHQTTVDPSPPPHPKPPSPVGKDKGLQAPPTRPAIVR
jgi:hypothetical protein